MADQLIFEIDELRHMGIQCKECNTEVIYDLEALLPLKTFTPQCPVCGETSSGMPNLGVACRVFYKAVKESGVIITFRTAVRRTEAKG